MEILNVTEETVSESNQVEVNQEGPSPELVRLFSIEHSRLAGDYYRDLSLNYALYEEESQLYRRSCGERGQPWPEHPFPNEKYTPERAI